ncbi:MAG: histidine phosphatase family protein [Myxococcota bacterium]
MALRQILLVRHGETDGASSIRYFGSTDVDLSDAGRAEMRRVAMELAPRRVDLWLASNLRRSWSAAAIVSRGASVRIEPELREIHFGQWEGLTREEIAARDPVLYQDWQAGAEGFEYPGGEARAAFRARVGRALERLIASNARFAVGVLHKGVIREVARQLTGEPIPVNEPALGEKVVLTRIADGPWLRGERSSDPPGLAAASRL